MERIINKIIRLTRKKYFLVVFVFTLLIMVLGSTYSYWSSESGWQLASELKFNELYYSFTIGGSSTSTIYSEANSGTVYYNVAITNLNELNTRYLLTYTSTSGSVTVKVSSLSVNDSNGIIGKYDSGSGTGITKTVRIAVTNNTASAATITLAVVGGYTWNDSSSVEVVSGFTAISGTYDESTLSFGLTVAQRVNSILNCTPTATSPCLYKENSSNNYVYYNGKYWRMMGSYLIDSKYIVKLVLDEPLTTSTTYSDSSSSLSTFYGTLNTSLIRTSSPFTCTGTTTVTCTGSDNIGLISKTEYDLIGGVNSYLYAKPSKSFWMNTESSSGIQYIGTNRGSSTLAATSNAYVKPSIYIKDDVVIEPGSEGTYEDPYLLAQGISLTVNANSGTTLFKTGYYAASFTYDGGTPSRTNYVLRDYQLTGTGSSLNGNVLTMGSEASSMTIRWWALYTIAYNCNGGSGSTTSSSHVEGTSKNLTANGCYKIISGTAGQVYKFLGWDTSSAGTTVVYNNAASVLSLTSVGGSTITMYAVWSSTSIFTYSASYNVLSDGSGNWRIKLLSSGNFVVTTGNSYAIDVFLVGGGGGARSATTQYGRGGGGGGYTTTVSNISLTANTYNIIIGGGGAGGTSGSYGSNGSNTTAFTYTALGGYGSTGYSGAAGGSGGGAAGGDTSILGRDGGSNGSNGVSNTSDSRSGGTGQGTTTREFGETAGDLYAGGGGGGCYQRSGTSGGAGGAGGGGAGGGYASSGLNGTTNTGGGGGGAGGYMGSSTNGGSGGSGIVVIRNKR